MSRYKKEKRKLLVKPKPYSGPHLDSQTAPFPRTINSLNPLTNLEKTPSWTPNCALNMPPLKIMSKFFYQYSYN